MDSKHNDDDISTNDDNYVSINTASMYVFDRNVFSKVGEGDIPPLEVPSPTSVPS